MIELSAIHNPYDFANPISDSDLFTGRHNELEEIKYYLDHAKTAPRPINLAALGARASGKTSLLNMIDLEAKKREFCVVRIDLDEGDVRSQMGFFFKVLDGLVGAACQLGAFGGLESKTYDVYLDMMNAYKVPDDKTFCPLLFPIQYAKAIGSGNLEVPLSDYNFKLDLERIRKELGRPVILLFDEGNVLASSRILLEKLRNIFMNTPGFMLVLTGTPDLFPLMDEVFSPIIRQFKKINVKEFKSRDETRECIGKPLKRIGIAKVEEIFDFETLRDVNEIHDLSGGRPYEIQLICHMLFRRVQARQAKKMKLNLSVLEDVRKELETSQNMSVRPMLGRIRNLGKKQLRALNVLCAHDGLASFEQIWQLEHTFRAKSRWTKQELQEQLTGLQALGVISLASEKLRFAGDDFDRIYVKYFAREQDVTVTIRDMPFEIGLFLRIRTIAEKSEGVDTFSGAFASPGDIGIEKLAAELGETVPDGDVFSNSPSLAEDLYWIMFDFRGRPRVPVIHFKLSFPWATVHTLHHTKDPNNTEPLQECLNKLLALAGQAEEVGGSVTVKMLELPVAPIDVLARKVERSEDEVLKERIALRHQQYTHQEYLERRNTDTALVHARLACRYVPSPGSCSINLGYLLLNTGEYQTARSLFESALADHVPEDLRALAFYNLAILECMEGNLRKGLDRLEECNQIALRLPPDERELACLLVPIYKETGLAYQEIRKPDLTVVAQQFLDTVAKLLAA